MTTAANEPSAEAPVDVPAWVRVRDRDTGHEYDVAGTAFDAELHTKVNASKQYPDLYGPGARPRPAKHRVDLAGQPAIDDTSTPSTSDVGGPAGATGTTQNGDSA